MNLRSMIARTAALAIVVQPLALSAREHPYYSYDDQGHDNGHHSSDTEKAVAGVIVGALALAAAEKLAQDQERGNTAVPYQEQPEYRNQKSTVVAWITTVSGKTIPIYLKRAGRGFVGPQGEFYPSMPSSNQLMARYGGRRPPQAKPPSFEPDSRKVIVRQGRVLVVSGDRTLCAVRPANPNVEKTRLINANRQLVVKSRGNHGPATVELFDVSNGSLSDKVLAFAIRPGDPSWALGMSD